MLEVATVYELKNDNGRIFLFNKMNQHEIDIIDFRNLHENLSNIQSDILYKRYLEIINNYQMIQKYTFGETTYLNIIAITSLIFKRLMQGDCKNIRSLEVGSWFGCSSYFNAVSLKAFSEDNYLFCMDTWEGSPDTPAHNIANFENVFDHFRNVMRFANVSNQIKPIVCDSELGFEVLQDNYFDMIFVDANHTYDYVYRDVINAVKKIKTGGLLMGHDCECYLDEMPLHLRESDNKNMDGVEGYHCGVIKALHDIFGRDFKRANQSLVWYKTITQKDKQRLLGDSPDKKLKQEANSILELSDTLTEALSYVLSNVQNQDDKVVKSLTNDTIRAISCLEETLSKRYPKLANKDLKVLTNEIKSLVINFKISYEDNCDNINSIVQDLDDAFAKWKSMINEEFSSI